MKDGGAALERKWEEEGEEGRCACNRVADENDNYNYNNYNGKDK